MKKQKITQSVHTNVNQHFEKEISLWKLITHEPTLEILQRTALCYQNDLSEGRNPRLPIVLISAKQAGLGSETLARCFANSLAMPLKVSIGTALSYGYQQLKDFFFEATDDTAFYIREAENLNPALQQNLYYVIKDKVLKIYPAYGEPSQYVSFGNRLIIIGTTEEGKMIRSLLHTMDLRLCLPLYDHEMIVNLLKQRIDFLGWKVESDAVFDFMAMYAEGNPNKAVWHLQGAYTMMRSENKEVLEMDHISSAQVLLQDSRHS